jgi:hypothetical protein
MIRICFTLEKELDDKIMDVLEKIERRDVRSKSEFIRLLIAIGLEHLTT